MSEYLYSPLSQLGSIRLLQLLSRKEDPKNLRCNLFEYPLRNSDNPPYPYEALSYFWGSENKPESIIIDDQNSRITENLYTVLLRLQYHSCSRIIWVDAICINQTNKEEKEHQIPLMAEIYAKATRVLVWLGEAEDNGDRALEVIRHVGGKSAKFLSLELPHQAILQVLQRQWFQRIWVRAKLEISVAVTKRRFRFYKKWQRPGIS